MTEFVEPDQGMLDHVGGLGRSKDRGSKRRHWLWMGVRAEPEPSYMGLYEEPGEHIGVCCSGGGIRSAAFNLGALQVVQGHGKTWRQTKYLSAVSGGSYIAAAFSLVAQRWTGQPNGNDSDPHLVTDASPPFAPGSPEEQYLRNHLGYLAPDGAAKIYLALRMVGGLLVNVLLIGLPVLMLGLAVGLVVGSHYGDVDNGHLTVPEEVWGPIAIVGGIALAIAALDVIWRPRFYALHRWAETWQVRLFLLASAAALLLIVVPWVASRALNYKGVTINDAALGSAATAVSSLAALAAAAITPVRGRVRDAQKAVAGAVTRWGKLGKQLRDGLVALVVILAGPLLLVAVSAVGVLIAVLDDTEGVIVLGVAAGVLLVLWLCVDLTTVSLHPFYRRRLATAFGLRRFWVDVDDEEVAAFTRDGRPVARQRPFERNVPLSNTSVKTQPRREDGSTLSHWPTLIVCAAANVSDPGATPPGRGVASFTFSSTAIGGPLTGAAQTADYELLGRNRRRDLTLFAAIAMSGAALSPSMGKLTYRPLTFLLALSNIRLGVWVPNPRHVNDTCPDAPANKTDRSRLARRGPERVAFHRPRPHYLWKELFGRNRLEDRFLYVTDGGHYENLGLVELLRRGCGTIYCFDAGGGSTSRALGDAIALARTELNVTINMTTTAADLKEDTATGLSKRVCAEGTITYPGGQKGRLVYVRSVLSQSSAWDLQNYRLEDGLFPHHSTFDQFFDDQKFEAYRRLGMCAAENALGVTPEPGALVQQHGYTAVGKLTWEPDQPQPAG
jgi:hypothetical protein